MDGMICDTGARRWNLLDFRLYHIVIQSYVQIHVSRCIYTM